MYLLDIDILSNLMRRAPSSALVASLARVPPEQQFTTSVTLGELLYGAHRMRERKEALLEKIESLLLPNLAVLPFDADAAHRYGEMRATLEQRGETIGEADLRIASIALAKDLTVVTANERHFRRVPGIEVQNWLGH